MYFYIHVHIKRESVYQKKRKKEFPLAYGLYIYYLLLFNYFIDLLFILKEHKTRNYKILKVIVDFFIRIIMLF